MEERMKVIEECKKGMLENGLEKMTYKQAKKRFNDNIMYVNFLYRLEEGEWDELERFMKEKCQKEMIPNKPKEHPFLDFMNSTLSSYSPFKHFKWAHYEFLLNLSEQHPKEFKNFENEMFELDGIIDKAHGVVNELRER